MPAIINGLINAQGAKHSAKPLQPAARRRQGIPVTKRAGDDHLRRADSHPDIMGTEPGSPVMRLQAGGAAHLGIHPRVDFGPWRPVALVEPADDQPVGALHPRLDRPEDGKPGMCLPAAPHRFRCHQLGQDLRKGHRVGGIDRPML